MNNSSSELVPRDRTAIALPRVSDQVDLVGRAVPAMMVSLLERRYLSDFQPSLWDIETAADDGGRPLLREVLAMGRPRPGEDLRQAMPHVLTAAHSPGQAVVIVFHGNGSRHRIYVGGRRVAGEARGSTEDYLDGQASLLQAYVPGLELSPVARMDRAAPLTELSEFLHSAPALAAVTGVPSVRGSDSGVFQNIDRLIGAVGAQRYALTVIAEPLDPTTLDLTVDHCRHLKSEIHALVRSTISRSATEGTSRSEPTEDGKSGWRRDLPNYLAMLAMFCETVGLFTGAGPLTGIAGPAMVGMSLARMNTQQTQERTTTTESTANSGTVELLDATAEACEKLLQRHIDRLESARSNGWWRTSVFVAAESDGALESVTAALRGISSGSASTLDPVRIVRPAPYLIRAAVTRGQPVLLRPTEPTIRHPLGSAFDALATCLTSDELAVLVSLPQRDIPGLPMRQVAEFALSVPAPSPESIRVGSLLDTNGREIGPVTLTADALTRHVFIAGMTGYGKTTTAKSLLLQTYATLDVPFLVIEPAKAEYRSLSQHPLLRGRLRVFDLGGGPGTLPLRLNPFRPVDGVPLLRHIDLLKAVFNAAFPMFAGMSYVLEDAMLELYAERGWNLHTSRNDLLDPSPTAEDLVSVVPSLGDLHDKIEHVLQRRQYGREVHQNIGAALRSRIGSLLVGTKGTALNTHRSISAADLFTAPCVIELRNLGDDEEKAFVMALLLGMLYEFAESRQSGVAGHHLQHVTLIEEAHRLLGAPGRAGSAESPDAQAKAVTMFTDMLAEMRSYGEGFIVADQIPTKLAPETLKNSNVKILHRLVAPDDRSVTSAAINLTESQSRHLANLRPGLAVVHDDRIDSAVLVRMAQPSDFEFKSDLPSDAPPPDRRYLQRNAACRGCPAPCEFLAATERQAAVTSPAAALAPVFTDLLRGDAKSAWSTFANWREVWRDGTPTSVEGIGNRHGQTYCAMSQACYGWLGGLLQARSAAVGASLTPVDQQLQHDRLAGQLARWCASWNTADTLDANAALAFSSAHQRLATALTLAPPRELPGCSQCPQRCRPLNTVAPLLRDQLLQAVKNRATTKTPPETRIRAITSISDENLQVTLAQQHKTDRRAFLYCIVTTAAADTPSEVDDVLATLREPELDDAD